VYPQLALIPAYFALWGIGGLGKKRNYSLS
jgi:hypothetical protein